MPRSREQNANTESVDNYLKEILYLSGGEKQRVSSGELAERLGVAPASVTNMIQKLAVECWRATSPSQEENSRPLWKAAPLPIAATIAVATKGPIPGICLNR